MTTDQRKIDLNDLKKRQMQDWVHKQLEEAADGELPPALIAELRLLVQLPAVTKPLPIYQTAEW